MDMQAQTVEEFCQAHRISRGTFYNLLKDGRGPRVMKVGARTLVGTGGGSGLAPAHGTSRRRW